MLGPNTFVLDLVDRREFFKRSVYDKANSTRTSRYVRPSRKYNNLPRGFCTLKADILQSGRMFQDPGKQRKFVHSDSGIPVVLQHLSGRIVLSPVERAGKVFKVLLP